MNTTNNKGQSTKVLSMKKQVKFILEENIYIKFKKKLLNRRETVKTILTEFIKQYIKK